MAKSKEPVSFSASPKSISFTLGLRQAASSADSSVHTALEPSLIVAHLCRVTRMLSGLMSK